MFDFKFDWCPEMECGIKVIDEQHQEFFRIVRDMEQLIIHDCKNTDPKQLLDIVCELREYATYHFYTDEALMQKYNYPKFASHMAQHVDLKTRVLHIDMPTLAKEPNKVLSQVKESMQDFLFDHVLKEDKDLCKFLSNYID